MYFYVYISFIYKSVLLVPEELVFSWILLKGLERIIVSVIALQWNTKLP